MKRLIVIMFAILMSLCGSISSSSASNVGTLGTVDGEIHYGEGTFYGGGYVGGCCMLDPIPEEYYIAAMNDPDYNMAEMSGAFIEVTGPKGKINVFITDRLGEGKKGDVDLNIKAFPFIADLLDGRVPISWRLLPMDVKGPVQYRYQDGSNPYWMGVQVRNHRYPISKLEYLDKNGNFVALQRTMTNYFESRDLGTGPNTFRLTDYYGHVIVDEDIPFTGENTIVSGKSQFPYRDKDLPSGTPTPSSDPTPTPSKTTCKISGYIEPDLISKSKDVKADFKVSLDGSSLYSMTDSSGYFEISGVSLGTSHSLTITKQGFLKREIVLGTANSNLVFDFPIDMWAGDIPKNGVSDNAINMQDIMEVAAGFNTTNRDDKYKIDCDLNKDNSINMTDIMIVAEHFNKALYPKIVPVSA